MALMTAILFNEKICKGREILNLELTKNDFKYN